jgi:hypothetical protein
VNVALWQPPPGWAACFSALSGVYALGFVSLVAGYFWARWFCIGLGMSGAISAGISMFQVGLEPALVFYGGTHAVMAAVLWGRGMAERFDGRAEWRARFHMDESASNRLGKAVMRAGISLPYIVMYALAPREGAATLALVAVAAVGLAGIWGLLRMRTWGVVAMAAGGAGILASLAGGLELTSLGRGYALDVTAVGLGAGLMLLAAAVPFVRPMLRFAGAKR